MAYIYGVLSDQLCACGCGQFTSIAGTTDKRWGHVRGEPTLYVRGHSGRGRAEPPRELQVNEDGLCLCGCGQTTPVATRNTYRLGHVKGEHVLYMPGHNPRHQNCEGVLYFVGAEEGPVKVGWTIQMRRRFKEFQTACWLELGVHGTVPGAASLEREAHVRLADHRIRGEWFEREPALTLLAEMGHRAVPV